MLEELDIRNVAVAEHVRLSLRDGFIALTGETGAGKSIIIDSLALLLGGPADATIVRAGSERARVEGVFRLPDAPDEALSEAIAAAGVEPEDGLLIISRELPASGRSVARVNGRAVVQSLLRAIGARLIDIHGQEDHLSILRAAEHLGYLDRYGGHGEARARVATLAAELRGLRAEQRRLSEDERERARRQDRLRFEVDEIAAADLQPAEETELLADRTLLGNAEELGRLAGAGHDALSEGEQGSAVDALGVASDVLAELAKLDPRLATLAESAEALQTQALELARALRDYQEEIESDPARLTEIETRLTRLSELKRKYGGSVAEVIAYGQRAAADLENLESSAARAEELGAAIDAATVQLGAEAVALSGSRRAVAARLSAAVEAEIADLGLAGGRFAVHFSRPSAADGVPATLPDEELAGAATKAGPAATPADALQQPAATSRQPRAAEPLSDKPRSVAYDRTGIDRVEFYVSLNPGEPLRPLARVASGGESARLMLALKTILGAADAVPTLVFDEVDVGVGGRSGHVVGEKLAALGRHHQVLCITHLPQVAACAGQHFAITKHVEAARTFSEIDELDRAGRERELAAMLGGLSEPNLRSAQAMLDGPDGAASSGPRAEPSAGATAVPNGAQPSLFPTNAGDRPDKASKRRR